MAGNLRQMAEAIEALDRIGKKGKKQSKYNYEPYKAAKLVPAESKSKDGEFEGFFHEDDHWHDVYEKDGALKSGHVSADGGWIEDEPEVLE